MKKYFISFRWITEDGVTGFSDIIKTSLNEKVSVKNLIDWKKEIINERKPMPLKGITILFFKEIK